MYLNKFFPILRNLGGYTDDRQTGREGLTLAGLMMFGKGLALFTLRLFCGYHRRELGSFAYFSLNCYLSLLG